MSKNKYCVTVVDYGDSCDGKARFLGLFNTMEDARAYVCEDIKDTVHNAACEVVADEERMSVWDKNHENGTEWNIEFLAVDNLGE